jgi:hypothetical protein
MLRSSACCLAAACLLILSWARIARSSRQRTMRSTTFWHERLRHTPFLLRRRAW